MGGTIRIAYAGDRPLGNRIFAWLVSQGHRPVVALTQPDTGQWWNKIPHQYTPIANTLVCYRYYDPEPFFNHEADLLISVKTDHIFTPEQLAKYPLGAINVHTALLPDYRGCNTLSHAILNGDTNYGITIHWMDAKVDAGPILATSAFPIQHTDTSWTLCQKADNEAMTTFKKYFPKILEGRERHPGYYPSPDVPSLYYSRQSLNKLRHVNLSTIDPISLDRRIRALDFPTCEPAYFRLPTGPKVYLRTSY